MLAGIIVMIAAVLILLSGAFPGVNGIPVGLFKSPVFMFLLGALSLLMLEASLRRWKNWKAFGFHLTHLGVVVILSGSLWDYFYSEKSSVRLPVVAPDAAVWQIENPQFDPMKGRIRQRGMMTMNMVDDPSNPRVINPGFGIAIKEFKVERYAPSFCTLYEIRNVPSGQPARPRWIDRGSLPVTEDGLDLGIDGQKMPLRALKTADGDWLPRLEVSKDMMLVAPMNEPFPPKRYIVYKMVTEEVPLVRKEFFVKQYDVTDDGVLLDGENDCITLDKFKGTDGSWLSQYWIDQDHVLVIQKGADKQYHAALRFWEPKSGTDPKLCDRGEFVDSGKWDVNHPAEHGEWRFYLSDYDRDNVDPRFVLVTIRTIPGLNLAVSGSYMLMLGVFVMYFMRPRRKENLETKTVDKEVCNG